MPRIRARQEVLRALVEIEATAAGEIPAALDRLMETVAGALGANRMEVWKCGGGGLVDGREFDQSTGWRPTGRTVSRSEVPEYFEVHDDAPRAMTDSRGRTGSRLANALDVITGPAGGARHLLRWEAAEGKEWTEEELDLAKLAARVWCRLHTAAEREQELATLRSSHQRFRTVAAASNDTIWDWDLESGKFWWSDGFARLFGWAAPESEATVHAWIRQIHPDDRERVVKDVYAAIDNGAVQWTDQYRFVSNDNTVSNVLDRAQILRDEDGRALRMVGGMSDITARCKAEADLERSNRALQMLNACSEMMSRTSDEDELLREACRLAVEIGGYKMAWIGYPQDDERKSVKPMAHAGDEQGYLSEITVTWADDHSSGIGPVGQAVRSRQAVVFEDVLETPSFSYWLAPARKRGYRSVVCLPLLHGGNVIGSLCLYGSEPNPATPDELDMMRRMCEGLAFSIGNARSRREQQRTQGIVVKVAQAISSGFGSEFFDLLTRNMVEALGAMGGLIGRYRLEDSTIETISYIFNGKLMEPTRYDLEGTPCYNVAAGNVCIYQQGVQQMFPEDVLLAELGIEAYAGIPLPHPVSGVLGIMSVFFSEPIQEEALVRSTLLIFAARAAAELARQQADARIREQASLLDKANDAILVHDLRNRITYWNKSAEALYGWSADEVLGESVGKILYHDAPAFSQAMAHTLQKGEWMGEMRQFHKNGRELLVEGRWTLVRGPDKQPESIFVLGTDISEHRKLEQQFLRAQRMESIGTLAGGIAHDLNNILAPISMAIELLKMRVADGRSQELLDTISASARRGAEMVGQVLSYARGMEGRRVEVRPRQLIREIERILRDTFLQKIELRVRMSRDLWIVQGDPTQLHQVLLNLCVNARDAVADGGRITISADNVEIDSSFAAVNLEATEGPHVRIQVDDTGEGIPQEIIERIFDPFFTTKGVGKGTGLGLSTSLAIVKSHGGFIRATSKPGHGSRFRVYLPARPDLDRHDNGSGPASLPRGHGEAVLVIDDELAIREITKETLQTFGYRVILAKNGEQGIALFRKHREEIAVVITDMMMPVLDGAATITQLLEIDPEVRVIATSGIGTNRTVAENTGPAVKSFLSKPFTAETLLRSLDEVLSASAGKP